MSGQEDTDKSHEPTQKRLDDARKKGEIARSTELTTAAAYAGFVMAALIFGPSSLLALGESGTVLLDQADRLAPLLLSGEAAPMGGLIRAAIAPVVPFLLLPAAAVLLALAAQRAIVFAPDKLRPKLSRISILSNAKQRFGRSGLFEFAKSLVKLAVISALLFHFLHSRLPVLFEAVQIRPAASSLMMLRLVLDFLVLVLALAVVIGGIDWLWQRFDFLRRNRMSRQELVDEAKESEGDPHLKQARRARAQEIAGNQMMADVPKADVVIVNPTHYAVALKWSRADRGAPVCVAKGTDLVAAAIRKAARENGVPIHSDPPTARALHATVEIGARIRPEHYRAVAAAIRFSEKIRSETKT